VCNKLKTAALVHNTFNDVGRIGGFFLSAGWRVNLFCKIPYSALRLITPVADNDTLQGEYHNDDLWLAVYGRSPCYAFLEG
jgi:hypothetical protein